MLHGFQKWSWYVPLDQTPTNQTQQLNPNFSQLFALYLSCANVLLLPYDVANRDGETLDMATAWDVSIYMTAVVLVIIIPFAYFFYENDNDPLSNFEVTTCAGPPVPFLSIKKVTTSSTDRIV